MQFYFVYIILRKKDQMFRMLFITSCLSNSIFLKIYV